MFRLSPTEAVNPITQIPTVAVRQQFDHDQSYQDRPNEDDGEQTLQQFKRSITKQNVHDASAHLKEMKNLYEVLYRGPIIFVVTTMTGKDFLKETTTIAYSTAIYILNQYDNEKEITLLFVKSRLALIKGMSIPRLELLTILIGIRVAKFVMKQLELEKLPVVLWSECALHWIQNRSKIATQIHPEQDRVEEAWLPFVDASRFSR
ncbi:Pao retrotransposon peptidase family protein [Dirofilaria immitis]|nr:Pao retrotransposon peptidase family protein [Dirofilaria immitis]